MSVMFVEVGDINSGLVASMVIGIDSSKNYTLSSGGGAPPPPPPPPPPSTASTAGASASGRQHYSSGQAIQVVIFVSTILHTMYIQ